MPQPAVQLNIFQGSLDTLPEILHRVADAGFEGVEFAYRLFESDSASVARTLERTGLDVVGGHVIPDDFTDRLDGDIGVYRQIGCSRVVVSHFDDERFTDHRAIAEVARSVESFAAELGDDFTVAYHNDGRENRQLDDGRQGLEELLAVLDDDVGFQLDVSHAIKGDMDPVALLERHADRIDTVHFRDAVPGVDHPIALGQGDVDLDALIDAADRCDVDWLIYEGNHYMDTLEGAHDRIRSGL